MKTITYQELLKKNNEKLLLVKNSCEGDFNTLYLPIFVVLSKWFNSIPLNNTIFVEEGGAFRCVVESSYFVIRQAKANIFTSHLPSNERRELEWQYRYAAFLSAISSWLDEPFRHFEVKSNNKVYNPLSDTSLTKFIGNNTDYELLHKPILVQSSRRTIAYATSLINSSLSILSPCVQDELLSSINPERKAHSSETVIQRVLRLGLEQAVRVEREDIELKHVSIDREVSSAKFIQRSGDDTDNTTPSKPEVDVIEKIDKVEKTPVTSSLPLPGIDQLPDISKQHQELISALGADILSGAKNIEETEWTSAGLLIPKSFLGGYGKAIQLQISSLQNAKIILAIQGKNLILDPIFGQYLVRK